MEAIGRFQQGTDGIELEIAGKERMECGANVVAQARGTAERGWVEGLP